MQLDNTGTCLSLVLQAQMSIFPRDVILQIRFQVLPGGACDLYPINHSHVATQTSSSQWDQRGNLEALKVYVVSEP